MYVYFAVADLYHGARIRFWNLCRFASGFEISSLFCIEFLDTEVRCSPAFLDFVQVCGPIAYCLVLRKVLNYRRKEFLKWKQCWMASGKAQGHNYPWSLFEVILFNFLYTGAVPVHRSIYGGKGVLYCGEIRPFFPQSNQVLKLQLWRGRCVSCDLLF